MNAEASATAKVVSSVVTTGQRGWGAPRWPGSGSATAVPVGVYLVEFAVVDMVLSLAFVSWPLISPNYFYLVDRGIWLWNWSKPAKAVNSSVFAVLLLVTENVWLCTSIAAALLLLKVVSLVRLVRLGIPVPPMATPPA